MSVYSIIRNFILAVLISLLCGCVLLVQQGYEMYSEALEATDLSDQIETIREKENYTELDQLPQMYVDAVVCVEDFRFYNHGGIDVIAILRAFVHDIQAMALVEGGSTITQQLAKNLYFTQEKLFTRKIAEVFMAFEIEQHYTKDEILELYVNNISFGNGYDCVGDASKGYFNKTPANMNDYESTLLAGIPNAPSAYDLVDNPELAHQRQQQVLEKMLHRNYLTAEEAVNIQNDSLLSDS